MIRRACYTSLMKRTDLLLAPCGMDCSLCIGYQRKKKKCSGCRATDGSQPKHCRGCGYAHCEILLAHGYAYCFECEKYPCPRIKAFDRRYRKWNMSLIQNLNAIRDYGEQPFLLRQHQQWACPNCRSLLCVHENACLNCGFVWCVEP